MARQRCLDCMAWHEPGKHTKPEVAETLTGQVPVEPVSGNLLPEAHIKAGPTSMDMLPDERIEHVLGTWNG